jgi:predicted transcriptional regulator
MSARLDEAAEALSEARSHVVRTLVVAASYVDRKAAEGDPEAQELARLIEGAFATMTCVGIGATTTIEELNNG